MVELKILVQWKEELDVGRVVDFVSSFESPRLVLVYSSVRDDVVSSEFFGSLVRGLDVPFVGVRVSGVVTNGGYVEDSVVVGVLCGGFGVKVFRERIDYGGLEGTADRIISRMGKDSLCLIYSANYYNQNVSLDAILRRVQSACPGVQFFGGVSAPPPVVVTDEGVFEDSVVFVSLDGLDFGFSVDSGFRFEGGGGNEFVITKSDEHCIYEINRRNAVEEYSKIQCIRPYFIDMLARTLPRYDVASFMRMISQLNRVLYEGVLKVCIHALGCDLDGTVAEFVFAMKVDEKNSRLVVQSYKPAGTVLKRITTSPKEQLEVYDRLYSKFPEAKAMLISACNCSIFWLDFDFESLEEKLKKVKYPFILSYFYGGYGTNIPYTGIEKNVVHVGTTKALGFK